MDSTHIILHKDLYLYDEWYKSYEKDLETLFSHYESEFKDMIDINKEVFESFCKLIYSKSSKRIKDEEERFE